MSYHFPHTLGHATAKDQIGHALESGKVSHAYLIQGPQGAGHFAMALDMALVFLCKGEPRACLQCATCKKVLTGSHPDFLVYHPFPSQESLKMNDEEYWEYMRGETLQLIQDPYRELAFEKKPAFSIQTLRQMQQALEAGGPGNRRVVALCDADLMTEEAANSILKILEEPPPGVVFLLGTSRPSFLLPTIVSRCQILRLGELSQAEVFSYLQRHHPKLQAEQLQMAARFGCGSLPRSQEYLEGELETAFALAKEWISAAEEGGVEEAMRVVDRLTENKDSGLFRRMLQIVLIEVRDSCIFSNTKEADFSPSKAAQRAEAYRDAVKFVSDGLDGNVILNGLFFTALRKLQRDRQQAACPLLNKMS